MNNYASYSSRLLAIIVLFMFLAVSSYARMCVSLQECHDRPTEQNPAASQNRGGGVHCHDAASGKVGTTANEETKTESSDCPSCLYQVCHQAVVFPSVSMLDQVKKTVAQLDFPPFDFFSPSLTLKRQSVYIGTRIRRYEHFIPLPQSRNWQAFYSIFRP